MKIDRFRIATLALWAVVVCLCAPAAAATSVEVLDTWPAGQNITLSGNQQFRMRLAYSSEVPAHIWMKPYFHGEVVQNAATNPSEQYAGKGETQVWFFFMKPGGEVDEVRITAGTGRSTRVIGSYRVHIVGSASPAALEAPPWWVTELGGIAAAAASVNPNEPTSEAERRNIWIFAAVMLCAGLAALAAPLWMAKGPLRAWLLAPTILMGVVAVVLAFDLASNLGSHDLWPFEFVSAALLGLGLSAILQLVQRLRRRT